MDECRIQLLNIQNSVAITFNSQMQLEEKRLGERLKHWSKVEESITSQNKPGLICFKGDANTNFFLKIVKLEK